MKKEPSRTKIFLFSGGVILCLFILFGMKYGWFTWQQLVKPPEKVVKIIAIKDTSIWIKGSSGKIYFNNNSYACKNDCWVKVPEPPTELFLQEGSLSRMALNCSYPPPLIGVIDSMAECRREQWDDNDSLYVLRFDGNLFAWHFYSGGENSVLVDVPFECFLIVIVIISGIIIDKWIRRATPPR